MYVYCGRSQTRGSGEIANDDRPVGPKALGAAAVLLFLPPLNRGRIYDDDVVAVDDDDDATVGEPTKRLGAADKWMMVTMFG